MEASLILRHWIRQGHRWLGILLTVTILANFGSMAFGPTPLAIVYAPLLPLTLLIFSGLYMFFLPYLEKPLRQSSSPLDKPGR
ncbi:MAG TPA: hypothetical protein DEQ45_01870 [Agrobacterium sp.]|nr:hypothetical protein CFBP6625_16255 [Agrobacterium tumefaciens]HCD82574.1 hypothetical protein [Agrobacterium sp.]